MTGVQTCALPIYNGNVKCNLGSEVTGGRDFTLEIDKENLDKLDKIQFIISDSNQNSEEN